MFKGIAPPLSQFPATVASGAPPRLNHAYCEEGVDVCFETLWRRGGGRVCNARNTFSIKKFSPRTMCPKRAHTLCPHTGCTSCAPTRRVPFMGFSSLGPQNMGDWSGGVEEGNERGAKSACPKRAQKRAEMLHHPCILGGPQQRGQIKAGPKKGGNATSPLHSRGSPNKGGQKQNSLPKPCLLGGPQVGGNATSPLLS